MDYIFYELYTNKFILVLSILIVFVTASIPLIFKLINNEWSFIDIFKKYYIQLGIFIFVPLIIIFSMKNVVIEHGQYYENKLQNIEIYKSVLPQNQVLKIIVELGNDNDTKHKVTLNLKAKDFYPEEINNTNDALNKMIREMIEERTRELNQEGN